jgi:hypothetical protein
MIGGYAGILEAKVIMSNREKKLASIDGWPTEHQSDCLQCGIAKRRRHSWFCRVECEDVYVEQRT